MDEFNEEEWERIALLKEAERNREIEEIKRLKYLSSIPFHKRIQEKGEEEVLARVKATQKDIWKKHGKGSFKEFWDIFLKTGISIKEYQNDK